MSIRKWILLKWAIITLLALDCELPVSENGIWSEVDGESTIKLTCGNGYKLVNPRNVLCRSDTSLYYNLPSCQAVPCRLPSDAVDIIPDFETPYRGVKPGTLLRLSCDEDHVTPELSVRCTTNTTFSHVTLPTCQPKNCIPPNRGSKVIRNGQITSHPLVPSIEVLLECDEGFKRNPLVSKLTCISGRKFSADLNEICKAVPCPIDNIKILHGQLPQGQAELQPGELLDFDCDENYDKEKVRVYCRSGHIFTGNIPRCLPRSCPEKIVRNGKIELTDPNAKIKLVCNEGYKQSNIDHGITCLSSQKYSSDVLPYCTESSCVPKNITNGVLVYNGKTEIVHGTVVTVNCGKDFVLKGSSKLTCDKGKLSPYLPSCQAVPCPIARSKLSKVDKINGAVVSAEKDVYDVAPGHVISITCHDPYDVDDMVVRCVSKNLLDPPSVPRCTRVICELEEDIRHGQVTSDTLYPDTSLSIQCDSGYALSHHKTVYCYSKHDFRYKENGVYVPGEMQKCLPLDCPIFDVRNGTVHHDGKQIAPNNAVKITCNENYDLIGPSLVTCIAGSRMTDVPVCKASDCSPQDVSNGKMKRAGPGAVIEVHCNDGYDLVGAFPMCIAGTVHSAPLPSCKARSCPIPHVQNGEVRRRKSGGGGYPTGYKVVPGTQLYVKCNDNYQLSGYNTTISCVTDNIFSGKFNTCKAKDCLPGAITNSTGSHVRQYNPGDIIKIECRSGYKISYTNPITCIAGDITEPLSLPSCDEQPCTIAAVKHSSNHAIPRVLRSGEVIRVTCSRGYQMSGGATVTCITDSNHTPLPSCLPMNCEVPRITNGKILNSGNITPGTRIQVSCNSGYIMSYSSPITCISHDIYSPPELPTCNDKECSVPLIENGKVNAKGRTISPGSSVTVTCNKGYKHEGSSITIKCKRANSFDPSIDTIKCKAQPCILSSYVAHGRYSTVEVRPEQPIQLLCDANYQISDTTPVYCVTEDQFRSGSQLTDILPSCKPRQCRSPTIVHGTALGPIRPGNKVHISCKDGYRLSHSTPIFCVAGNLFQPQILPTCQAQACPGSSIPHGRTSRANPGDKLDVVCDENYAIDNPNHDVRCITLNQFSNTIPQCKATPCELPSVANGQWLDKMLKPGGTTSLKCLPGYSQDTYQLVRCISGRMFDKDITTSCIENCILTKEVPNGYLERETRDGASGTVKPGQTVRVECNAGYDRAVADGEVLTCATGNLYNPPTVQGCKAVPCSVSNMMVDHGRVRTTLTAVQPGQQIAVECDPDYELSHKDKVTCLTRDTYSAELPLCLPQPCPVPSIPNGELLDSRTSFIQPAALLEYTCKDGYYNTITDNVFCVTNTTFSSAIPECKPVKCPPPKIVHGTVTGYTEPGDTLNITCQRGLVLLPVQKVTCITKNLFSPAVLPKCTAIPCSTPTINYGYVANTGLIEPGNTVDIRCNADYQISHSKLILCISDSVYSVDEMPSCNPLPCQKPIISNGIVRTSGPILPGHDVELECGTDYVVSGGRHLTCISNTTYQHYDAKCVPQPCVIPPITNGHVVHNPVAPGAEIKVRCDLGYKLDCETSVTCVSANNTLPTKLPRCLAQICGKPDIPYGVVTGPTPILPGSALIVQCNSGYTLSRITPTTCVTLEMFKPSFLPSCVPIRNCTVPYIKHGSYVTPLDGGRTSILPGTELQYRCTEEDGSGVRYVPLLQATVTCLSGDHFHPVQPRCITEEEAKRIEKNENDLYINDGTEDSDEESGSNALLIVLIILVIILLVFIILIICICKNPKYKEIVRKWLRGSGYKSMADNTHCIKPAVPVPAKKPPRSANKIHHVATKPLIAPNLNINPIKGESNVRVDPLTKAKRKPLNPKPESESITIDETELDTYPIVKPKRKADIVTAKPKSSVIPCPPPSPSTITESEFSVRPPNKSAKNKYTVLSDSDTTNSKDYDNVLDSLGLTRDDFKVSIEGLVNRYY